MPDTARSIARDMVGEVGWLAAVSLMAKRAAISSSWGEARRGLALLWAVIVA